MKESGMIRYAMVLLTIISFFGHFYVSYFRGWDDPSTHALGIAGVLTGLVMTVAFKKWPDANWFPLKVAVVTIVILSSFSLLTLYVTFKVLHLYQ